MYLNLLILFKGLRSHPEYEEVIEEVEVKEKPAKKTAKVEE